MAGKKSKKNAPSKKEVKKLRKEINAVTKTFFARYGYDVMMVGPPGPRPPPKLELKVLNLSY
jgi:hypothetical protein